MIRQSPTKGCVCTLHQIRRNSFRVATNKWAVISGLRSATLSCDWKMNMKRCPQCNRVETDEALAFCRADGTALVNDSSSLNSESGTMQLGTSQPNETATSILPQTTPLSMNRSTGPTTVLPVQQVGSTSALLKTKRRRTAAAIVVILSQ